MKRRLFVQSPLLLSAVPAAVQADAAWPSRALTYVVPLAPGGATDILGRLISERLAQRLGVPVVVENKTGAGGSIGSEFVARAPADGYTLLGGSISTHAINVSLYPNLGYDPIESFDPIAMIGFNPLVLAVPADSPHQTVQDLIAAAKKSPGAISYASAGNGTSMHLATELLAYKSGTRFTHVPFKGSNPALQSLLGKQVDMLFDTAVVCAPFIQAGRIRALATGSTQRLEAFPSLPTVVESGVPDFEVFSWLAVFARRGARPAVVERLRTEVGGILAAPEVVDRMKSLGTIPVAMDGPQMTQFLKVEIAKWKQVISAAEIRL